jgi:4-amino-4-deoxy-L-arabinose transferase-like glycosyltransferase
MSKYWLVFICILVFTGFSRLFWLDRLPAGFTPDEAAFGYNAYSLLTTGSDEWGTPFWKLPLTGLKSFGDYKLPLYAFLSVPCVKIFGLNEFSARLPNAVMGILSVALIFILAVRLGGRKAGLLAAFIFCISPWNLSLSRGAFEAYTGVFFILLGLTLFVSRRPYLAALIMGLAMYSYHTPRLIIPLLILPLVFIFVPLKKIISCCLIFAFVSAVSVASFFMYNARSSDISIFNPADNWQGMSLYRATAVSTGWPVWLAQLVYNKMVYTLPVFFRNYLAYFSPRFLFEFGPGEASYGMLPGTGVLYIIELPFLLGFLIKVLEKPDRRYLFLLFLLLIAPVPAALTKGAGMAANRASPLMIPLVLMSSLGAVYLFRLLRKKTKLIGAAFILLLLLSTAMFLDNYRKNLPLASAKAMGYGWKDVVPVIQKAQSGYGEIRFSRSLSEPHIYLAFFMQINPAFYQASSYDWSDFENQGYRFLDQYDGYRLGDYRFGSLNYNETVDVPTLYVGRPDDFPPGTGWYVAAGYPDGTPAIVLAEKSPRL